MKPIIGIICRPVLSDEKHNMFGVYEDMCNAVINSGGIPIGILPIGTDISLIKLDGLIFQGGDSSEEYEKEYLKYAYDHDIPTLGICLGMQTMGEMFDGVLDDVVGHKAVDKQYVHGVRIDKNSKLYKAINKDKIMVNSRHKSALISTSLKVVGISDDGVTEAIEDLNKKFFIGVQWHPESMITYDKVASSLFDYFIDMCRK